MNTLLSAILIITILDYIYQKLFFNQEEEQFTHPPNEVLRLDKEKISQYLKIKHYKLASDLHLSRNRNDNIGEQRIYDFHFKTASQENGKASILIKDNGNIVLLNLIVEHKYRTKTEQPDAKKDLAKSKTYLDLKRENRKLKDKLKQIKSLAR